MLGLVTIIIYFFLLSLKFKEIERRILELFDDDEVEVVCKKNNC